MPGFDGRGGGARHGWVRPVREQLVQHLVARLDQSFPLILDTEEMERLGGPGEGYEAICAPTPTSADFKHRAAIDSSDHQTWLQAAGTI